MRSKVLIVAFGSLRATQQLASSGNSHPRDGQLLEPLMGRSDASKDVMAPSEIGRLRRRVIDTRSAAKGAIDALNSRFYDSEQAIWSPGAPWWLSGVAITSVIDYMHKTRSSDYMDQVNTMIEKQRAPLAWWPQGDGDFRGDSTDDTGWWGLAMIRMFDLTGNATYLNISMEDEAYMYESWTDTACGGGIYVDIEKQTYKNAIANELYIKLAASLHNRVNNDTFYLERAETAWSWFRRSGMINSNNLINDGLSKRSDGSCVNNKLPVWTYNEGVILGGLSELYLGTSNTTYLTTARTLADALLLNTTIPNSTIKILTEICEPPKTATTTK
ncbi:hypothetical protein N0V88_002083 [Collariella sp. IMI 366227]|nr:hypothetical protein N0V88_002083 [Collariella sp. IMI 366227]